jgi:uncharacterized delta-60 repeat protein
MQRRTRATFVAVVTGALLMQGTAWAVPAPGELDPSFSNDGRILLRNPAADVEVLPSGKSLVVDTDWAVRRYTVDGSLDLTYGGGDGVARPDFSMLGQQASEAALQPDGKLVIVGTISDGQTVIQALARLTPAGALDGTFSGDGKRTIVSGLLGCSASEAGQLATSVAIAPNGRIIVCGTTDDEDVAAIAFTPEGGRVTSFGGGDGVATVDFAGASDSGEAVVVRSDGRIVLAATTCESECRVGVVRLDCAGVPDPSFSGDGRARVSFQEDVEQWGGSEGKDVTVHPTTGDVFVGGDVIDIASDEGPFVSFAVARFSSAGLLERRWTATEVANGHTNRLRAIDLVGQDVIAVGLFRDSIAECCGWYIVRFGSVQYATQEYFDQQVDFAADVDVFAGKAYVAGQVSVVVGSTPRRGGVARFIA